MWMNQTSLRVWMLSPVKFTLNVLDGSIEPAVIDLSFLNQLGADKVKEYTGVDIARVITNQINREYGDQRFFDFTSLKATETATTADLFKLISNQEDQTPTEDDEIVVTLTASAPVIILLKSFW